MTTIITYKNVLKFSSIFILMFFYSCTSDDIVSDNPSSNDKDFLEKYDGYGFISDDDGVEGWYFNNSDQFLKYFFQDSDGSKDCLSLKEGTNNIDGETYTLTIVTNNQLSLLLEIIYNDNDGNDDYSESLEFTVDSNGNTLTIKYDNDPDSFETYTKTSLGYSSFCN